MPCNRCDADSECSAGHTCAAVNPALGNSGNYCLPIRTTTCGAQRPYAEGASETSDRGAMVNYCRPRTTTCEAVLHHASPQVQGADRCTNAAPAGTSNEACGAASVADGLCRTSTGGDNYCTYPCASGTDNDCRTGFTCAIDATVPGYGARCSI
jgi:hypothetical protein